MSRQRAQVFIGRLPLDSRVKDLQEIFDRYGKLTRCDLKYGSGMAYAFVEYEDSRDAQDAIKYENGKEFRGHRIVVEWSRGTSQRITYGAECYKCHRTGHWIRDCPENDRNGFYRGQRTTGGYSCSRYRHSGRPSRNRHTMRGHSRDRSRSPRYTESSYWSKRSAHTPSNSPSRSSQDEMRRNRENAHRNPNRSRTPSQRRSRSRTLRKAPRPSHTPPEVHSRSPTPRSRSLTPAYNGSRSRTPKSDERNPSNSSSPSARSVSSHVDDVGNREVKRRKSQDSSGGPRNRRRSLSPSGSDDRRYDCDPEESNRR